MRLRQGTVTAVDRPNMAAFSTSQDQGPHLERSPSETDDLTGLFERVPEGWSVMAYGGRPYGVTRSALAGGRILKVYARDLAGTDVVSANLYLGRRLRPCEMPADKVLSFLRCARPVRQGGEAWKV